MGSAMIVPATNATSTPSWDQIPRPRQMKPIATAMTVTASAMCDGEAKVGGEDGSLPMIRPPATPISEMRRR